MSENIFEACLSMESKLVDVLTNQVDLEMGNSDILTEINTVNTNLTSILTALDTLNTTMTEMNNAIQGAYLSGNSRFKVLSEII